MKRTAKKPSPTPKIETVQSQPQSQLDFPMPETYPEGGWWYAVLCEVDDDSEMAVGPFRSLAAIEFWIATSSQAKAWSQGWTIEQRDSFSSNSVADWANQVGFPRRSA